MSKSTSKPVKEEEPKNKEVKLPPLNFGVKQSIFSGGKPVEPKSFIPKPVRVTQHKGG